MPYLPSPRLTNLGIFVAALVAMLFALWLQYYQYLDPCPLCVFQRLAMIAAGLVALAAFLHGPAQTGRRVYAGLTLLATVIGIAVAGRHVWLQHLPPEDVPACGPGLDYWMDTFPLHQVMMKVFKGSGECAVIDWTFLGLSLPAWTLAAFAGLAAVALWQLLRRD
ncbi:MAG: disulfide bond formation protein [Moraxellaceae bacterium]|jgi:disulfide bond formation protein DsbB|nr:disulfide bond formation protein [Moraxellaceae bacterium]